MGGHLEPVEGVGTRPRSGASRGLGVTQYCRTNSLHSRLAVSFEADGLFAGREHSTERCKLDGWLAWPGMAGIGGFAAPIIVRDLGQCYRGGFESWARKVFSGRRGHHAFFTVR